MMSHNGGAELSCGHYCSDTRMVVFNQNQGYVLLACVGRGLTPDFSRIRCSTVTSTRRQRL
jgi:hypothetical protein